MEVEGHVRVYEIWLQHLAAPDLYYYSDLFVRRLRDYIGQKANDEFEDNFNLSGVQISYVCKGGGGKLQMFALLRNRLRPSCRI